MIIVGEKINTSRQTRVILPPISSHEVLLQIVTTTKSITARTTRIAFNIQVVISLPRKLPVDKRIQPIAYSARKAGLRLSSFLATVLYTWIIQPALTTAKPTVNIMSITSLIEIYWTAPVEAPVIDYFSASSSSSCLS